jgi:hypothetical protein
METKPNVTHYRTSGALSSNPAGLDLPFAGGPGKLPGGTVRRRPDRYQGRALEALGHAIEYLVDSDLRSGAETPSKAVGDASQILMGLSRKVFTECAEVVPLSQRIQRQLTNMFGRPGMQFPAGHGTRS